MRNSRLYLIGIFLLDIVIWLVESRIAYLNPQSDFFGIGIMIAFAASFLLAFSVFGLFIQIYNNSTSKITTYVFAIIGLMPVALHVWFYGSYALALLFF